MSTLDNFSWIISASQHQTQDEKDRYLEICNNILIHGTSCDVSNCPYEKCQSIKFLLEHSKNCNNNLYCELCKSMLTLNNYHVYKCEKFECSVENCGINRNLMVKERKESFFNKSIIKRRRQISRSRFGQIIHYRKFDSSRASTQNLNKICSKQLILKGFTDLSESKESNKFKQLKKFTGDNNNEDIDDWYEDIKIITNINGGAELIKTYRVPKLKFLLNKRQFASQEQIKNIDKLTNSDEKMNSYLDDSSRVSTTNDQEQLLDGIAAMNIL